MIVSYKLMQDNNEIKKGTITIPNMDKTMGLKMFESLKKRTWKYLDQYDENITVMSKLCVDKVMTEIQ